MNKYIYNLEDDKFIFNNDNIDEMLTQSNDNTIIVECDFCSENIVEKIEALKSKINGRANFEIVVKHNKDYIYDEAEINKLQKIDDYCKSSKFKMNVKLNNAQGELKNVIFARNEIEDFAIKLNSLTINENQKQVALSPIEKYFVVYKFVANRVYNMSEDFSDENMRNWVGVLTGDKVICSGFSSLLKCVCDRVFDKNELVCYKQGQNIFKKNTNEYLGGHASNLIIINDKKYGVNGLFASDACWGCKSKDNNMQGSFEYCLNPTTMYVKHKQVKFAFSEDLFFYKFLKGVETTGVEAIEFALTEDIVKTLNADPMLCKKRKTLILEKQEKLNAELKKQNAEIEKEYNDKINKFLEKNKLQSFNNLQVPEFYPTIIVEKYPELKKFNNLFNDLTTKNLLFKLHKFKKLDKYYNNNKEVFASVEKFLKDNGFDHMLKTASERILDEFKNNSNVDFTVPLKEVEKQVDQEYEKAMVDAFTKGKSFLFPQQIPDDAIKNGLTAVANFAGLNNNKKIEEFINREITKINHEREVSLGMDRID